MLKKVLLMSAFLFVSCLIFCDDIKLISFADDLFDSGDYYRAITEYKRYIFYENGGKFVKHAQYRIGVSYLKAEKYEEAEAFFEKIADNSEGLFKDSALLAEAFSFARGNDYKYSAILLKQLEADTQDELIKNKSGYLMGLNYLEQHAFGDSVIEFQKVKFNAELAGSSDKLANYIKNYADIEQRAPAISSLFSAVIPGAGYAYCGDFGDAIVSLLINGFFIYNTAVSFHNNSTPGKYAYGIPAAVFYFSNIYGSANAAKRFNDANTDNFIDGAAGFKVEIINTDF
jgi:hypothetical protein